MFPKQLFKGKMVFVSTMIFIIILIVVVFVVLQVGKAYRGRIQNVGDTKLPDEMALGKLKEIRKITIKKRGEEQCFEVTPDGIVRVYQTCDGKLTDALRLTDPKEILKLFRLARETDLSKYHSQSDAQDGTVYEISVETDTGTQTYTIIINNSSHSPISEIGKTIENIITSLPHVSPSPSSFIPFATPSPFTTPAPTPTIFPSPTTVLASGEAVSDEPFTCDFSPGSTKPYRISGVVCTSEPR